MRTPSRAEEIGGRERRGAAPRHAVEALGVGDIRGEYGPGRAVIHGRGRAGEGTGRGTVAGSFVVAPAGSEGWSAGDWNFLRPRGSW